MKTSIVVFLALAMTGCAMTPAQRKAAYVAGAVVVTAVAISANGGNSSYCGDGKSVCGPIRPAGN